MSVRGAPASVLAQAVCAARAIRKASRRSIAMNVKRVAQRLASGDARHKAADDACSTGDEPAVHVARPLLPRTTGFMYDVISDHSRDRFLLRALRATAVVV